MEHGDARFVIGIESDESLVQRLRGCGVHRIAHFGPVQRHDSDGPELLDANACFHSGHYT